MLDIELKHVHIKQILNTRSRIYTLWGRYKTCQTVAKLTAPSLSHKTRAGQNYSLSSELCKAGWKVSHPCILITTIAKEIYNTFLQSSRNNCKIGRKGKGYIMHTLFTFQESCISWTTWALKKKKHQTRRILC